ncbi:signal peptidase II [Rarobacter faecitabidus]|uniref:Lipoprotein signal peptidase n=1 Tax=Rarobacter faecitabidus TaxID=13243 RepID=A0A542ZW68_RARFA|nr:signal peptidase II [Rarobacter faecitabidus]TQL64608.1 signal peptidase II [Rarobacter faecitabidus]
MKPAAKSVPIVVGAVGAVTVLIDQLTKWWALSTLTPNAEPIEILGRFLGLRLVLNPGAALSLGASSTWIMTSLAVAITVAVIAYSRRVTSRRWAWALGFILGGAVGNLIDRFFRAPGFGQGHVVDFIDYQVFVGNVADIALVGAAVYVVWLNLTGVPPHAQTPRQSVSSAPLPASSTSQADPRPGRPSDEDVR